MSCDMINVMDFCQSLHGYGHLKLHYIYSAELVVECSCFSARTVEAGQVNFFKKECMDG